MTATQAACAATTYQAGESLLGNYFVSTYPPFSCWTEEGAWAYRRALDLPAQPEPPNLGLYVHFPFCVRRCDYCYYLSYDDRGYLTGRYVDALVRELELYRARPALAERKLDFVYFGGGTPSMLNTASVRDLLVRLQSVLPWDGVREVSFECAPRTVTEGKLQALAEGGVNRLSLGVQQLDDRVLELNQRVHGVADVQRAWQAIRRVGFATVNLDLISGLVGETESTFTRTLDQVLEMAPESVTIYQLEVPLNTPLSHAVRHHDLAGALPDWKTKRRRVDTAFRRLEAAGYTVRSAYAAVRDPTRHSFLYQDAQYHGADLLGIGASSFSFLGGLQQQNVAALEPYLERLQNSELPLWRGYSLSQEEMLVRELVLQLKLGRADSASLYRRFGIDVADRFGATLSRLADQGWLVVDDDAVRVTRPGLLRIDRLLPAFYLPRHRGVRYA